MVSVEPRFELGAALQLAGELPTELRLSILLSYAAPFLFLKKNVFTVFLNYRSTYFYKCSSFSFIALARISNKCSLTVFLF